MVVFNIFFEPVQKFNERITELDNYISFNEALIKWTQGIRLEDIVEPLLNKDICIFKMDSYSLSTSLVFENIDLLIKIFTEAEIKDVYIHNPPKRFFKSLKQQVPSEILKV